MGKNNKYHKFPPRKQVPVGGVCLLCQCNRQVRMAARPFVKGKSISHALGFPAAMPLLSPGMIFKGVNNLTGEEESFKVQCVLILNPERSSVERIK